MDNLAALLRSQPDEYSALDGTQLVSAKVRLLVSMGGTYPKGTEWNFQQDAASAAYVATYWPSDVVWSGYEVGASVMTGGSLSTAAPADDPVRTAYELYIGPNCSRPSWDVTAVHYAVWPDSGLFRLSPEGRNYVNDSRGENLWVEQPGGRQWYLIKQATDDVIAAELDRLMLVTPQC